MAVLCRYIRDKEQYIIQTIECAMLKHSLTLVTGLKKIIQCVGGLPVISKLRDYCIILAAYLIL